MTNPKKNAIAIVANVSAVFVFLVIIVSSLTFINPASENTGRYLTSSCHRVKVGFSSLGQEVFQKYGTELEWADASTLVS